jgi:predicted RNase H-like nuclease (RuvC/YqgF family)
MPTPTLQEAQSPTTTPASSFSNTFLHPEMIGLPTELIRARENIAKLEERQNRSFVEELSAAKLVARLESEAQSKDRELMRLEIGTTDTVTRLESELQRKDRELMRLEATANTVARLESELQSKTCELVRLETETNASFRHILYACAGVGAGLAAIAVWRR